ncbi:hypothetical protein GCM10011581_34130 [Saccharopolyspora subtropica]|uniref:DUF91 domain-containing protein n=1 Tax=Saccharopolyspora thermophila TaxID=89367 RepID=A0A917JZA7_9PSEU|nr:hypothetical protein GCM10011581_34130 [Saccharopolyspora subtropica]
MPAIWTCDENGRWGFLTPSEYPAERVLHDLVKQAPQMLPLAGAPRLTVLGSEVRLGNGYADLIAVESSGRLVIIEVKLADNSEARRAVVAQVLSYAAHLQGLLPRQLEGQILDRDLAELGCETVLNAVEEDQEHTVDAQAFSDGLAHSLAEGNLRLVIVLDEAPDELVQLTGYLQSVTDKLIIDLITVTSYQINGQHIVVPQRVEPAPRSRALSDAEALNRQAGESSTLAPRPSVQSSPTRPPHNTNCCTGSPIGQNNWPVTVSPPCTPTRASQNHATTPT